MRGSSRLSYLFFCALAIGAAPLPSWAQSKPADTLRTESDLREIRHQKVAALLSDARKLYEETRLKEATDLIRQATVIDPQDKNAALMLRIVTDKIIGKGPPPSTGTIQTPLAKAPSQLVVEARKLYDAAQYREAADLLRQATIIYPQDETAALMLRLVMDKITAQDQEPRDPSASGGINGAAPTSIRPYEAPNPFTFKATVPIPPADDVALTELSMAAAGNRFARNRLEENLKEITAENQPLDKVLIFLRDSMGNQILVNWAALHDAGIEKTNPVSVSLKQVPFRKALTTVLAQVSGGTVNLSYTLDAGNIVISTKADLGSAAYQIDKTYDIRDMLATAVMPATTPATLPATAPDPAKLRQAILTSIIDTIRTTVAPDTWKDAGGKIGTIREENGLLIIHQTLDNQLVVYDLLQQLRETRSIQTALEARILIISPNFLDDFRIGWNAGPATAPGPAAVATAPKPDFEVHAAIIDNWTLNLLLSATQADKGTITLTAPRLTLFNAGEAQLECRMPQRYITGYSAKPVPIEAAPYGPDFATTDTGIRVTLQTTVSADRRSVVAHLNLKSRILTALDHAPATNPNLPANANLFLDKPTIKTSTGTFTLAIPDSGTLLLDAGPVPANFPVAEPLDNKNRRRMLILIRPTIITHREIDSDLFGVGDDRSTGLPTHSAPLSPTTPSP